MASHGLRCAVNCSICIYNNVYIVRCRDRSSTEMKFKMCKSEHEPQTTRADKNEPIQVVAQTIFRAEEVSTIHRHRGWGRRRSATTHSI